MTFESRETGPRWYSPGSTPMDARIAGTARTSPRLLAEIVPPLNSPTARERIMIQPYGEIRENGPFMIILHPTNNLITRILIGEKQVELLNPQVPPSKSHRILRGSSSRPLNKEYIEDRLTTRICRLEGVVWKGAPLRLFAPFLRRNGAWWLPRRRLRSLSWVW